MKYFSTRNSDLTVSGAEAIVRGLAPDGGLFVPDAFPEVSLAEINELCKKDYRGRAASIMEKYLPEFTADEIKGFVCAAYGDNFDCKDTAPLHFLDDGTAVLELWHGPTCAFKDMALQMLPHLLTASLRKCGETREVCILVATSGDTGKAALEGFADVPGTRIMVFYPRDGVSDVQKLQMVTQRGGNVNVCSVKGNFDDAQTGVKKIFSDKDFAKELSENGVFLSSANSINWGRLLPQIAYYFSAYCDYVNSGIIKTGDLIDFAVPTGNFGNILAGYYAKQMGLPVRKLICCSNENKVLTDFLTTGVYDKNRKFFTTISPSMDILVSSNLERLLYSVCRDDREVAGYMAELSGKGCYTAGESIMSVLRESFAAGFCTDAGAKKVIGDVWSEKHYLMDTHTAVAYKVYAEQRDGTPTVVVSTASPFKFCDSVLDALGEKTDAPGTELIGRLSEFTGIASPAPLSGLDRREVRFTGCAEKSEMKNAVAEFLK